MDLFGNCRRHRLVYRQFDLHVRQTGRLSQGLQRGPKTWSATATVRSAGLPWQLRLIRLWHNFCELIQCKHLTIHQLASLETETGCRHVDATESIALRKNWVGTSATGLPIKSENMMCDNAGQPDQTPDNGQRRFESFSPRVQGILQDLDRKLKPARAADRLWERLAEEERERLGGDVRAAYERCPSAARMWAELYRVSQFRAYLEAGHELGFVSDADYHWLMREIGESEEDDENRSSLCWDRQTRELRLGSRIIRRVRSLSVARNLAVILDAFEEAGWPRSIETPTSIDTSLSADPVHDAVRSLNGGLEVIRFHADEGGQRIFWTRP